MVGQCPHLLLLALFATTWTPLLAQDESPRVLELREEIESVQSAIARVELEIDELAADYPPAFELEREQATLLRLAEPYGLRDMEIRVASGADPRAGAGPGLLALNRLVVAARGGLDSIGFFFERVAGPLRPAYVETARLESDGEDSVRFESIIILPTWSGGGLEALRAEAQRASEDPIEADDAAERLLLETLNTLRSEYDALSVALGISSEVDDLAERSITLMLPLERLTKELDEDALALSQVRLGDELTLKGVALGARARDRLVEGLAAVGLMAETLEWRQGDTCWEFSAVTRMPGSLQRREDDVVFGSGLLSDTIEGVCTSEAGAPVVEIGGRGTEEAAGEDFLIRSRDIDSADLFRVLHHALGVSFVVGADVAGRVSVTIDSSSSFDDLREADLLIGTGPLHLVSRVGDSAADVVPPADGWTGPPADITLRRTPGHDLLCLLQGALGVDIRVPGALPAVSVYASGAELDAIVEAVVVAAEHEIDRSREPWVVSASGQGGSAVDPCEVSSDYLVRDWLGAAAALDSLGAEDLELKAMTRIDGARTAYAYGPAPGLLVLEVGAPLYGGQVTAVSDEGVDIELTSGELRKLSW